MNCSDVAFHPSSDAVDVAVHDFGGEGPLVVFCHATGFCAHAWAPLIEALKSQFRCVALDFRAHGLTELPAGVELVWRGMAEDLTAVIDALSPGQPVLAVGHSMGASAIVMAETARPGLIERAWLFEPILLRSGPVNRGENAPDIANAARSRRATFPSRAEAEARYASRPPLGLLDPRALSAYVEHGFENLADGSVTLRCRPENEASVFEHHNSGAFDRVAELRIPVIMAVGNHGQPPAQWVAEAASTATSEAVELIEMEGLSHFGPLESPDRLAVDIARFLGGVAGSAQVGETHDAVSELGNR